MRFALAVIGFILHPVETTLLVVEIALKAIGMVLIACTAFILLIALT